MKCPKCGAPARGKFCPECGSALETARCAACQAKLESGARFCTQCGSPARRAAFANAPWYVVGTAIVVLIVVLLVPGIRSETANTAAPGAPPFAGANPGGGTPPPLSDNMRENADRLFNRVMEARENGDSADVKQFAPMGVIAYENSGQLDSDGLYHLTLLQLAAGDPSAALVTATKILEGSSNHLLALSAAADASLALGDSAAARKYFEQFTRAFPVEKDKDLPEYLDHVRVFPRLEAEARQFLAR